MLRVTEGTTAADIDEALGYLSADRRKATAHDALSEVARIEAEMDELFEHRAKAQA